MPPPVAGDLAQRFGLASDLLLIQLRPHLGRDVRARLEGGYLYTQALTVRLKVRGCVAGARSCEALAGTTIACGEGVLAAPELPGVAQVAWKQVDPLRSTLAHPRPPSRHSCEARCGGPRSRSACPPCFPLWTWAGRRSSSPSSRVWWSSSSPRVGATGASVGEGPGDSPAKPRRGRASAGRLSCPHHPTLRCRARLAGGGRHHLDPGRLCGDAGAAGAPVLCRERVPRLVHGECAGGLVLQMLLHGRVPAGLCPSALSPPQRNDGPPARTRRQSVAPAAFTRIPIALPPPALLRCVLALTHPD